MAEFIVFIRSSTVKDESGCWIDQPNIYEKLQMRLEHREPWLSREQIIRSKEKLVAKYQAIHRPGDIVEVFPDGFFCEPHEKTGHGWNHHCFALVKCPGISLGEAKQYQGGVWDETTPGRPMLKRKFRYSVASLGLKAGEVRVFDDPKEFRDALKDKANG